MTTTAQVADDVLKTLFEGEGAHVQMREYNPTLDMFEESSDEIEGGSKIEFPLQKEYQQGLGARSEGEDLATPGSSNYIGCSFPLKKLTFSVEITTEAWKKSKNKGVASFVDLLSEQTKDVMGGFYRDCNTMLYGDGTGLRTQVDGAVAGPAAPATIVVDSTQFLFEGMLIDIYRSGGANPAESAVKITSVSPLTNTIIVNSIGAALVDNDEIYRAGNKDREKMGLSGFVNDSGGLATLQGITVGDQAIWEANVLDNGGTPRNLTRNLMDLGTRAGMGVTQRRPDTILMGLTQARKYANTTVIHEQYEKANKGGKISLDAGYEKLLYKDIKITEDPDCPDDLIYMLQRKGFLKLWSLGKPEFIFSPDSNHIWYRLEGKGKFRADGEYFVEFGGYRRNNQTVITDLITTG